MMFNYFQVVRRRVINEGFRVDGRHLDEVRPVYCESSSFPILHGSSIFSRGDTQVRKHASFIALITNNLHS